MLVIEVWKKKKKTTTPEKENYFLQLGDLLEVFGTPLEVFRRPFRGLPWPENLSEVFYDRKIF